MSNVGTTPYKVSKTEMDIHTATRGYRPEDHFTRAKRRRMLKSGESLGEIFCFLQYSSWLILAIMK